MSTGDTRTFKYREVQQRRPVPADAPGWPDAAPAHFLVVEDDPIIGQAVVRSAAGLLRPRLASSGAEALAALAERPLPRFVLLDFRLPDMDGLDVLRHLRAQPALRLLPVVVFSSLADPGLIARTRAAGADDWVQKPDDPRALHEAVRQLCRRWGGLVGDGPARGNGSHAAPPASVEGTGAGGLAVDPLGTTSSTTTHSTTTTTTTTRSGSTTTTTTTTVTVTSQSTTAAAGPATAVADGDAKPADPPSEAGTVTWRASAT